MELSEIKLNTRVRVPATENGGGYHYAYVRDICRSLFSDEPIIIVEVPALKIEKAVAVVTIAPARKVKPVKEKQNDTRKD